MSTLDTPDLSHASHQDWDKVYEPAEDTFLLLDALEKDWDFITKRNPSICLEVGSGSGTIISAVSKAIKTMAFSYAVDINADACRLTRRTARQNNVQVEVINSDLMTCLRQGAADLVIFNPPYVVTSHDEVLVDGLHRAWAGGECGREVIDRFLEQIPACLSKNGVAYLLLLKENKPHEVMALLQRRGFTCLQIAERKLRGEFLVVIRFEKAVVSS